MSVISLIVTMLILFISVPSFGQEWFELDWMEYDSRIDSFGVTFPGEPTIEDITYTTEYQMTVPGRVYSYEAGPNLFSVTVVDYTKPRRTRGRTSQELPRGRARWGPVHEPLFE